MKKDLPLIFIEKCPLCGESGNFAKILEEKIVFNRNENPVVRQYDGLNVFLNLCSHCQFAFASPLPGVLDFFKLKYDIDTYSKDYGKGSKKKINRDILEIVSKFSYRGAEWLDVGANEGDFLHIVKEAGYQTSGIEVSRCFKLEKEHDIFWGSIDDFIQSNKKEFNVISLVDVFEHLERPQALLGEFSKLLRENGLLYIKVPHYKGQLFKQLIARKLNLNNYSVLEQLDHINHFTPYNLQMALKRAGFEILQSGITRSELYITERITDKIKNMVRELMYLIGFVLNKLFPLYPSFNFYILAQKK